MKENTDSIKAETIKQDGTQAPSVEGQFERYMKALTAALLAGDGHYAALKQLLRREPPRLAGRAAGQPIVVPAPDLVSGFVEAVRELDRSYLCVQEPPGAGKTYTGSHMIAALLAHGCRVGTPSNSH